VDGAELVATAWPQDGKADILEAQVFHLDGDPILSVGLKGSRCRGHLGDPVAGGDHRQGCEQAGEQGSVQHVDLQGRWSDEVTWAEL
jgi:hypothetical protein